MINKEINTFNKLVVIVVAEDTEKQQGIIRGIEALDTDNKISIVHATTTIDETTLLLADVLKAIIVYTSNIPIDSIDTNKVKLYNVGNITGEDRVIIKEELDKEIVDKLLLL